MKNFENIQEESAFQLAVEGFATSSKRFDKLLRLGLVSRDNLTKARRVFKNPNQFGTTSNVELRQLVMDILQDIMSSVVDDSRIYNLIYSAYLDGDDDDNVNENVDEFAKFTQLAKAGLIDRNVLTKTLRILRNPTKVSVTEYKTVVMNLLMSLLDKVVGDQATFSAVKRSLAHEDVAEDAAVANTASAPGLAMVSDGEPTLVKQSCKKKKGKKCCD